MDLDLAECGAVEGEENSMQKTAKIFIIEACHELSDLLLCNRGGQVDIPSSQAGESFRVAGEQTVKECRAASQVTENEKRFLDCLILIAGEENIIEPEAEPMDE